MDEKKFDDMMERWADREHSSAPRLRPTRDMYTLLKSRRQTSWYPVIARWATVGVAAAVIVIVAVLHPSMIPVPLFQGKHVIQETGDNEGSVQEARNEAKDMDAGPERDLEQDSAQGFSVSDKGKQEFVKKSDKDKSVEPATMSAEPARMPSDAPGTRDIRQTAPGAAPAPPVPETDAFFARSPKPQIADEKQVVKSESVAARPASVSEELVDVPAELPVSGEKQLAEPMDTLESPKSRAVTDFGPARSKTAARRGQEEPDADRKDARAEEQKAMPLADRILGEQMVAVPNCTPLPDASRSSPMGSSVGGRSSATSATLSEPLVETESELSAISPVPAPSQICAIQLAEKTIGDKTFRLQKQVWIDTEYDESQERLIIRRDSRAYADLLTLVPDMRVYAESGEHILVTLKTIAIEIAPEGQTQLTDANVRLLELVSATP